MHPAEPGVAEQALGRRSVAVLDEMPGVTLDPQLRFGH
jgi:hypothetical protein